MRRKQTQPALETERTPGERGHGFVGTIYEVLHDEIGFIRPEDIRRQDGDDLGFQVTDDVFVHLNAFKLMQVYGYRAPSHLERGMVIMFTLGPSRQRPGRLTAEFCTLLKKAPGER
jgi:hypothetical protein